METSRHENIAVRIPLSLRQLAEEIAQKDGVSLNHFVTVALQEKINRMQDRQQTERPQKSALAG
jgi:predicted HicB family RNase H-like nuclease